MERLLIGRTYNHFTRSRHFSEEEFQYRYENEILALKVNWNRWWHEYIPTLWLAFEKNKFSDENDIELVNISINHITFEHDVSFEVNLNKIEAYLLYSNSVKNQVMLWKLSWR